MIGSITAEQKHQLPAMNQNSQLFTVYIFLFLLKVNIQASKSAIMAAVYWKLETAVAGDALSRYGNGNWLDY